MNRRYVGRPRYGSFGRHVDRVRAVNFKVHPMRGGFAL